MKAAGGSHGSSPDRCPWCAPILVTLLALIGLWPERLGTRARFRWSHEIQRCGAGSAKAL